MNIDGRDYVVEGYRDAQTLLLRDMASGKLTALSMEEILEKVKTPSADKLGNPVEEELLEIAMQRYEVIKDLVNRRVTRQEVEYTARKYNCHPSTVYRWIRMYREAGNVYALIPNYKRRGNRGRKIPEEIMKLMDEIIEKEYLSKQRPQAKKVYRIFALECQRKGLNPPHYNTFLRRIASVEKRKLTRSREGRLAGLKYESIKGEFTARYPLEILEVDHTQLDIIVVDPIYRKPIGRPYLTAIIDVCSRVIFGFYLSLEPPSFFTFGQAFFMGVAPKEPYLERLGVDGTWDVFGLPRGVVIHTDNAKEFRGKDIENFLKAYGINQEFRPKKTPHYGGHIERFFRTLNEELHHLPGTTFSEPRKRKEYNSEGKAALTVDELERYIAEFIVNIYHRRKHSGIGTSPIDRYRKGILGDDKAPGVGMPTVLTPEELKKLRISLLRTEERTVSRKGVQINYVNYWHEVLISFIGEKHLFKVDPRDISRIYFFNPGVGEYYEIPCRNTTFPPMSVWELREVLKHLRHTSTAHIDEYEIARAYEQLKRIQEEAVIKKKKARRDSERKRRRKESVVFEERLTKKKNKTEELPPLDTEIEDFDVEVF